MPLTFNGSGTINLGGWSLSDNNSNSSSTLDDYEEGTWNPYWSSPSGTPLFAGNPSQSFGSYYQKIGNMVYFYSYFGHLNSTVTYNTGITASTSAGISGFPYVSTGYGAVFCYFYFNFVSWDGPGYGFNPMCYIESGTTFAYIGYPSTGQYVYAGAATFAGSNSRCMIGGFYITV